MPIIVTGDIRPCSDEWRDARHRLVYQDIVALG